MPTLTAIGDSQTDPFDGRGLRPEQGWPHLLGNALADSSGRDWIARNFGLSGDTTALNLARLDVMGMYDTPEIAAIYVGVNDPGAPITTANSKINWQAMCMALKHGAFGMGAGIKSGVTVAGQASLPANGQPGQRYVVLSDTSTNGGAAAANVGDAATITGSVSADANGNKITVWENRNPLAGVYGWGRVAISTTAPSYCEKILVVSTNYLNFTTGGDTPSTPASAGATLRTAMQAVVSVENVTVGGVASVVYVDLYNFQRSRIVAGTDPNFSSDTAIVATTAYDQTRSWHYIQDNQHHNAYGDWLVAQAALAAMPASWKS